MIVNILKTVANKGYSIGMLDIIQQVHLSIQSLHLLKIRCFSIGNRLDYNLPHSLRVIQILKKRLVNPGRLSYMHLLFDPNQYFF